MSETGHKTINEIQAEVVGEFELFDDWMAKYEYLIEMGKSLPLIDEKYKRDEFLVRGCQSRVWLRADLEDGLVRYKADSDAVITRGIIGLLIRVLSGQPPEEIVECDLEFIDEIGLKQHLSPNRSNGLVSMVRKMKNYALAFAAKEERE